MGERKPLAVYAITRHGLGIAARLAGTLGTLKLPMGPVLSETFTAYDCHVFAISVGAVVRMIAPLIKDKEDRSGRCLRR